MTLESRKRQGTWHGAFTSDTRKRFENYYIRKPVHAGTYRKKYIRDYEQEYYERCKELNANVYITVGGEEESGFVSGIESFEMDCNHLLQYFDC